MTLFYNDPQYAFGGYNNDAEVRFSSTSGGAFSAIVESFCDDNYVVFGATADGLDVYHTYITDKKDLGILRKSKYSQSKLGKSFNQVKTFLAEGKKVLFSGTPCQIAGLKMFLEGSDTSKLLLVEVVCEGVPSPLYLKKYNESLRNKYNSEIKELDYRYTGKSILGNGKWDFQVMKVELQNGKVLTKDRWFNSFWSIWLKHLMSRPSCNVCPFAKKERVADITLGDLWGVHLYCPELYGKNGGSSIVIANSGKGRQALHEAQRYMIGHELKIEEAIKYQSPLRKHIEVSKNRESFMLDLKSSMSYEEINNKWGKNQKQLKLLYQKYVWGNRQKIWLWNFTKGKYKIK